MKNVGRSERGARRLNQIEGVFGELYQVLGTLGAPARVLDQVLAAVEGRPLPYDTLLPFSAREGRASAAAALGARGGSAVSTAKARAARMNGRHGGRPRAGRRK
jgi:hypothetical protein